MPQKGSKTKSSIPLLKGVKRDYTGALKGSNVYLSTIFLILWIVIGIFALLVIVQSVKQGLLSGLFAKSRPAQTQTQPQTEAQLPGIGMVNIACVQQALSQESIQKILQDGSASGLTDQEKSKLDPCIVAKESATPSASPSNK